MAKILIIDDEPQLRALLARIIGLEGYDVEQAPDCTTGLRLLSQYEPDVVLCDVKLPDGNGVELVGRIKEIAPAAEVILLTAYGNIPDGVQAIKNGAFDYITKGDDNNKILPLLSRATEKARMQRRLARFEAKLSDEHSFDRIIGSSEALRQAVNLARKVAATDTSVLLTGETGTGKEVFAQAIHQAGPRAREAFVAVNCSAFSKELLESELFGHRAGSFTGATKDKKGLFEEADKGTLFLDEIGEMPQEAQVHLLRVLESRYVTRVGDHRPIPVDVRVIAATQTDLMKKVREGTFRKDLWFRLAVLTIVIPPLRDRKADIPALVRHFLRTKAAQFEMEVPDVPAPELERLYSHDWPGNVRELEFVIERSLLLSRSKAVGTPLKFEFAPEVEGGAASPEDGWPSLAELEQRYIRRVLEKTGNKRMGPGSATELLGVHYTTLRAHMLKMGLPLPRRKEGG